MRDQAVIESQNTCGTESVSQYSNRTVLLFGSDGVCTANIISECAGTQTLLIDLTNVCLSIIIDTINKLSAILITNVKKTYQFKTRCKDDMVNSVN